jgi:hypothetical protein
MYKMNNISRSFILLTFIRLTSFFLLFPVFVFLFLPNSNTGFEHFFSFNLWLDGVKRRRTSLARNLPPTPVATPRATPRALDAADAQKSEDVRKVRKRRKKRDRTSLYCRLVPQAETGRCPPVIL